MEQKRILIVEDESITAEDIAQRLEGMDYTITGIAGTGEEAIELANKTLPDLVLMDVKIKGGMDGIESADIIRQSRDIPIIYLTAYTDSLTINKIKMSEPYGLMMKPFQDSELQGVIETALYKHGMEQKLRLSEKKYRETSILLEALFDTIPDIIGILDKDLNVIRYNKAAYAFLNVTPEEVVGKKCYQLIHRTAPCDICASRECLRTKKPARRVKFNEEFSIWLDCRSYPLLDDKGKLIGIIEHLREITPPEHQETMSP